MVSEFLFGMTRTSHKPHLMGLSVTNKLLIDEVSYQFARRISNVASTAIVIDAFQLYFRTDVLNNQYRRT